MTPINMVVGQITHTKLMLVKENEKKNAWRWMFEEARKKNKK